MSAFLILSYGVDYTDFYGVSTTRIKNIRVYLLTALYYAPITIGPYYAAAVRHDFG